MPDPQLRGAPRDRLGLPARQQRERDAGFGEHLHSHAVARAECLQRLAVRPEPQAPVGQHAVDVERHQLESGRTRFGRRESLAHQITRACIRSCVLSAPITRCSPSTTSNWLMRFESIISTASTASTWYRCSAHGQRYRLKSTPSAVTTRPRAYYHPPSTKRLPRRSDSRQRARAIAFLRRLEPVRDNRR